MWKVNVRLGLMQMRQYPHLHMIYLIKELQVLSLSNIYMVDDSRISTFQISGYGWVWMDSLRKIQLMGM